jgi:hypothetical protein
MSKLREWPSREQWAAQYQHPYWDGETGRSPYHDNYSHQLSDYSTPEEVAALTTALKNLYRDLDHELRALNLRIKPWKQQRGELSRDWYRRFRQLPTEDQETVQAAGHLRQERSWINDLLTRIRDNEIPNRTRNSNFVPGKAGELVAPVNARYWAAFEAARDAYFREYAAQHPADDTAWEKELQRRAEIDARYTPSNASAP